jgi:hypothetical protein
MAVQDDPIKPKLKPPETKRLKPNCDVLLSNSAYKFNLRRYNVVRALSVMKNLKVRRCRLTQSDPRCKRLYPYT